MAGKVVDPSVTYASVTDQITGIPLDWPLRRRWLLLLGATASGVMLLLVAIAWLLLRGVGIWGINIPVAWGFAIINFVWWIGIGHAGTLISAILLLCRQRWRSSINRFAETMTLFAVTNAALFPLLHLGRIQRFYYLFPYPDTMNLWPQWRSPLVWDVFAVMTYFLISALFWYQGLLPDLAALRDRARRRWPKLIAGVFALGWRNSARHWERQQMSYLLLAGLATPLVVSVHSIVSLDFSVTMVPGWHTTVFPPYFVAGAIYSGFAMVFALVVPARRVFKLHNVITARHYDAMAKIMLASGLVVAYGYLMENFVAWYSGNEFERFTAHDRAFGPYAGHYWATLALNVLGAQALWFRRVRTSPVALFLVALVVNVGMWLERYVIVIKPLHRDFMPSAWGMFSATFWDWALFIGTLGLFAFAMLLFVRVVPMVPMSEVRELVHRHRAHEPPSKRDHEAERTDSHRVRDTLANGEPPAAGPCYGLVAEFDEAEPLLEATRRASEAGYRHIDAFSPFPVEGLAQATGQRRGWVPPLVLIGAVLGAAGGYFMQWYSATLDYPHNIGGRPLHSWPSFIPLTFELAVLGGGLFGFFGMLALNRLPKLYHSIFNAPGFERVTRDRFFLCIERKDPKFDYVQTRLFLQQLDPLRVSDVPE